MSVMIEEQETHINWMRGDGRAEIYTSDTTTMTKLNKLVKAAGTEWKLESVSKLKNGEIVGKTYSCPVDFISFRSKRTQLTLTDEERVKRAEQLAKNRKK